MGSRGSQPPQSRRTYIKGIGAQHRLRFGRFTFKGAPLRRRKKQTIYQQYATGALSAAAWFQKLATPFEYQVAKNIAGQSGFTWKDQMLASFYGTGVEFMDKSGQVWIGRRILAKEIQQLLDSISSTAGSILVRTANGWAALYPGAADNVLTMNGDTGLPDWEPSSGGGGGANLSPASINQHTASCIASGVCSLTLDEAPTPGNALICLTTHYANSVTPSPGWSILATGPTGSDDAFTIFSKIASDVDDATLEPSTTSTGWCAVLLEIEGGYVNTIQAAAGLTNDSALTEIINSAAPQDKSLIVGMFMAQARAVTTITLSGATVDTLDSTSNASSSSGGPRTLVSWAAHDQDQGAFDLTATYGSSGVNGYAFLVIAPNVTASE